MKKILSILFSTLLVLTIFSGCKANKPENTLTPNPPTGTTVRNKEEKIETTVSEVVPETEKKDILTKTPETKSQQKPVATAENKPSAPVTTQKTFKITKEEAKQIALGHAGLAETDISRYKSELDRERKTIVYEIEFKSGKYEYEYEINADTGKVIKAEKEIRN